MLRKIISLLFKQYVRKRRVSISRRCDIYTSYASNITLKTKRSEIKKILF